MTPRQEFQLAMLATAVEDIRDRGSECVLCGEVTRNAGIWWVGGSASKQMKVPDGKSRAIVYSACDRCHDKPGSMVRIENAILEDYHAAEAFGMTQHVGIGGMLAMPRATTNIRIVPKSEGGER